MRTFSFVLLACVSLAVCTVSAQTTQTLRGHIPAAVGNSRLVQRMPSDARLNLAIGLPVRNPEALDRFLESLSDPTSPNYRHYLSPEEFTAQFGPLESDYNALLAFTQSHGLTVIARHPNRMLLDVSGTVSDVETAFHLRMMSYQHPERGQFFAPDREPSLDLDVKALDIAGLDNFDIPHPMALRTLPLTQATPLVTGSGPGGMFIGKDFRAAYAPGVALDGSTQTVGLLEFDGFYAGDLTANFKQAGLAAVPTQTVLLNGFNGAPGSGNIEVILDIAMAGYMAPGVSKVIVYEGLTPNDILNRMATDNLAQQLSSSWGFSPVNQTTEQIFKQFIAQGQSFFQASGDSGAYKNGVMPPSDDPNVTVVGGTSLTTSGSGGAWHSESTWSGSGGGVSTVYPLPTYQQGLGMAASGGSLTMRNIPDVALTADVQIFLICNNGQKVSVGGTSAAAPLWAGFTALANQKAFTTGKARVGFLNPLIYAIGKGAGYLSDFHDINLGSNSGFNAVAGYDLATGWGTPGGQHLIDDLLGTAVQPAFSLSASQTAITMNPGGSASVTVSVVPQNGFTGTVALVASGLPVGVSASFSPASAAGKSVLTLVAGKSVSASSSTITVGGTSGALTGALAINLAVATPNFTLAAAAAGITLKPGTSGTETITVAAQNGFSGIVTFSASGLPQGVTATFSAPNSAVGTSITLAAGNSAPAGTTTVTVTGISGNLKSTATFTVMIAVPNFSLLTSSGAISVPRGTTAGVVISVSSVNGFTGNINLAVSSLSPGLTSSFGTATGSSLPLVFAAGSTASVGTFTVTVSGTSAGLSHSVSLLVTVVAPAAGTAMVNLAPFANVAAIATDGSTFTPVGLDGGLNGTGTAYSATLLGGQQTWGGVTFYFGGADVPDAVSGKILSLPSGQYSTLRLLATAVNGNQVSQTFKVTYSDGTTSSYIQSMSDWFTPQSYPGEAKVLSMAWRNISNGVKDNRNFMLYGYSLNLDHTKKVSSITLPNDRNVVVLGVTLVGSAAL